MTATPSPQPPTEPAAVVAERSVAWVGLARGLALFFGGVFFLNLLAQLRLADFDYDPNHWWLSFRPLPKVVEQLSLICVAVLFVSYAVAPTLKAPWRRRGTRMAVEFLWVLTAWNLINFYGALTRGAFRTSFPVPFPLFMAGGLAVIWLAAGVERPAKGAGQWLLAIVAIALAAVVFPLLQIVTFGLLDHRARATGGQTTPGAAIVFNGEAETAVRTAADLLTAGRALTLFIPGGGPSAKAAAVKAGVPSQIIDLGQPLDAPTLDAAVRQVTGTFPKDQLPLYVVNRFDQSMRIDVLFSQEGRTAYPVPVVAGSGASPGSLLHEVGQLWACYFSALRR